jgi:hypothetical protein
VPAAIPIPPASEDAPREVKKKKDNGAQIVARVTNIPPSPHTHRKPRDSHPWAF